LQKGNAIMNAKSILQIAIAGLALSLPLAASSAASARVPQHRHAVRNHGHDDRVIVRNPKHGTISCINHYGNHGCYDQDGNSVPRPTVRDHRSNPRDPRRGFIVHY
jgi:hypothetical protein